ncbi:MAG TPA: hypothetical protein VGV35_05965, partial [Bryobacteraceae bacterium]|nr:hypothetical protein [Bryobacteraceae bacterium]
MRWWSLILLASSLLDATAAAQNLAAGKLLAASRKSLDPDLAQTVILLTHYGQQGAIGLILNRP